LPRFRSNQSAAQRPHEGGIVSLLETAIATAAHALGLPPIFVAPLVDLLETIAAAPDVTIAIARARVNVEADAADLAAETLADRLIRARNGEGGAR
jgi:hypothetical protein